MLIGHLFTFFGEMSIQVLSFCFWLLGSSLLHAGFLHLQRARATLHCGGARASHCGGFSCCRAWAVGTRASVVVAHGL